MSGARFTPTSSAGCRSRPGGTRSCPTAREWMEEEESPPPPLYVRLLADPRSRKSLSPTASVDDPPLPPPLSSSSLQHLLQQGCRHRGRFPGQGPHRALRGVGQRGGRPRHSLAGRPPCHGVQAAPRAGGRGIREGGREGARGALQGERRSPRRLVPRSPPPPSFPSAPAARVGRAPSPALGLTFSLDLASPPRSDFRQRFREPRDQVLGGSLCRRLRPDGRKERGGPRARRRQGELERTPT